MSDAAEATPAAAGAPAPPPKPKLDIAGLIPPFLNTLALLSAFGLFFYSKFVFKRPIITETVERAKLEVSHKQILVDESKATFLSYDPITVNIVSSPTGDPANPVHKLHYATIAISFEIRDESYRELIEAMKPYIMDQLIVVIGKQTFDQLTTIQGRYILQSQIQDACNRVIAAKANEPPKESPIVHTYFNNLVVQ